MLRLDKSGHLYDKLINVNVKKLCYRNEKRRCGIQCMFCCFISKDDISNVRKENGVVLKCMNENSCYFSIEIDDEILKRGKVDEKCE